MVERLQAASRVLVLAELVNATTWCNNVLHSGCPTIGGPRNSRQWTIVETIAVWVGGYWHASVGVCHSAGALAADILSCATTLPIAGENGGHVFAHCHGSGDEFVPTFGYRLAAFCPQATVQLNQR